MIKIESDGRQVTAMTPLNQIKSNKITAVNGASVTLGGSTYNLSDKVQIYVKSSYPAVYHMITREELKELAETHRADVYTDKPSSTGGQVRIIVLSEN